MAKNDIVLLDGIIDQRLAEGLPSQDRGEVFEFFVLEEVLKDYDLSCEELEAGWVDGAHDGGIDGFDILVNGNALDDPSDFAWPRTSASIDTWIFTCKHHASFLQAPLDALLATIQELFDLSIENAELSGKYSAEILGMRTLFSGAYKRLSINQPSLTMNVIYGSRGDTTQIGESVSARSRQIEQSFYDLFSNCTVKFRFFGASELIKANRRVKTFTLELPFVEHLATGKNSYVLLVKLRNYWRFVSDDDDHLKRYLFDSNVRDYLGANNVNDDISRSLLDTSAPDFWWLNNGVTILATDASVTGKSIQLKDIQIVNGLQTTETIFRHFNSGSSESIDRALLVKVVISTDSQVHDQIIRATNNQSPVEISALHATDTIQRDIETILERHNWYYERRRNYYRNIGKPRERFVSPLYIASAVVALVFKNPVKATRLKSRFMRNQSGYDAVFSEAFPIEVWPALASIYKTADNYLARAVVPQSWSGERLVGKWRALVSLLLVAKKLGTFSYRVELLAKIDTSTFSIREVQEIWELVNFTVGDRDRGLRPTLPQVRRCCTEASKRYGLLGKDEVGRRTIPSLTHSGSSEPLSKEFVDMVNTLLPDQPWRPGVHLEVASKLDCKPQKASKAIQQLISDGKRNEQRDGIVYDPGGVVLAVDPERVAETVEQLNSLINQSSAS